MISMLKHTLEQLNQNRSGSSKDAWSIVKWLNFNGVAVLSNLIKDWVIVEIDGYTNHYRRVGAEGHVRIRTLTSEISMDMSDILRF